MIDRGPITGGCAVGSAGHLVPSHVVPLAAPGALATTARGLLRKNGAVSVNWSASPGFWRWIVGFTRSCTRQSVASAAPALSGLASLSTEIWDHWLARSSRSPMTSGLLDVYRDTRTFERARAHADELRRWGVTVVEMDGLEAVAMEPALRGPVAGAVHLVDDRSVDPRVVMADLVDRVRSAGVELRPSCEVVDLEAADGRVRVLRTSAGDIAADHVVVAAGAWTGRIAERLGERIAMLAAKGLSVTVDRPDNGPRRPLLLGEDHVAVGPMGEQLRLSAWFQLNDFDTHVSPDRITRLEAIARCRLHLEPTLRVRQRWAGLRPVTPDGVPIIGPSSQWANVTIAAGHSMVGLTLGPGTGRLVAQLVCGEPTSVPIERFAAGRFR
ncbi:FAD-binding oxidoreductase [soil metagenome]